MTKDQRGRDAFDAFFGAPTPRGSLHPEPDDEPTQDVNLRDGDTGELPEDWWAGDRAPEQPEPVASSTWHARPAPVPAEFRPKPPKPPRRGIGAVGLVALLLGGVLLGAVGVFGAMNLVGGDEPVAQSTTVTTPDEPSSTSGSESTSDSDSSSSPSSSTSSSPSTSSSTSSSSSSTSTTVERTGVLPAGASQCAGPSQGTSAGSGTELTSCPFAVAVRDAYLSSGAGGESVSLEVRSPVTDESYTMQCAGSTVTRCTGGNNAVVYLY